jgi:hypothetical protein
MTTLGDRLWFSSPTGEKQVPRVPGTRAAPAVGISLTLYHAASMVDYTIVPMAGRGYWIEATEKDGSHRRVERYATEDEAVSRLRVLREKAGLAQSSGLRLPHRRRDW